MRVRDNTDEAAQAADDHVSEYGTGRFPDVEIFGSSTCLYCTKAKELCIKFGLKYRYFNIDEDFDVFDHLVSRIKTWKTVPQIFWGPDHVGGYDELTKRLGAKP
jgi:glutaredoxin